MKKILCVFILALVAVGFLMAAGQQDAQDGMAEEDVLKAALLTSGPINDGGWNTFAYEGLLILRDEYGFEVANTENVQQSAQKSILELYADKGYDLIIGHGFEYGESITEVAQEYPDTIFFNMGGLPVADNVGSAVFAEANLGYLTGKVAAMFTETDKIGFVGAMEIPTIVMEVEMIKQVVSEVNPDAEVVVSYTGSWTDVNKGKEAALAQINQGVDVIIAIGDAADFGAIKAAEEEGAYVIGWVGDFNKLSPNVVLTSGVQSVAGVIADQGRAVAEGTWEPTHRSLGVKDGFQYMGTWSPVVPEEIVNEVMADQARIISGELVLEPPQL